MNSLTNWIELERIISTREAARLRGVSEDTFLRNFPHLIRRISPRRVGVRLGDVLSLNEQTPSLVAQG
jgi:hypothetical protein